MSDTNCYIVPRQQGLSIQESEKPKRNLVAVPDRHIVIDNETVWHIRNLRKALALAADFRLSFFRREFQQHARIRGHLETAIGK